MKQRVADENGPTSPANSGRIAMTCAARGLGSRDGVARGGEVGVCTAVEVGGGGSVLATVRVGVAGGLIHSRSNCWGRLQAMAASARTTRGRRDIPLPRTQATEGVRSDAPSGRNRTRTCDPFCVREVL